MYNVIIGCEVNSLTDLSIKQSAFDPCLALPVLKTGES